MSSPGFVPMQIYRRRDLHERFGGQRQGGISTPSKHPFILLFTGESGQQYGYKDGWTDDGVFRYTGEGQSGDMRFVVGNRAIRDHVADGKDLYLFKQVKKGFVSYVGQMVYTGHQLVQAPDKKGTHRKAIVFELSPIDAFLSDSPSDGNASGVDDDLAHDSLAELRQKALADSAEARTPSERKANWRKRSRAIRRYVLKRAGDKCEGCEAPAPFKTAKGRPYLEPHHIRRLTDGGPDHPHWVIGVCPNCHQRAHHSADAVEFNQALVGIVEKIEGAIA